MTDAVFDFASIKRKLNRMEQKADFDAKNPEPQPSMYGWPGAMAPLTAPASPLVEPFDWKQVLDTWGVKV